MRDPLPTVGLNGWAVADVARAEVVDRLARAGVAGGHTLSVCLHVVALGTPSAHNQHLASGVDLAYADGMSVVLLARLAGARRVEKTTTTYIAGEVLNEMARMRGRPVRVAMVGGPPGLAERATEGLRAEARVDVVNTTDGYPSEEGWAPRLRRLHDAAPEVILVGLGHPLEVEWVLRHRAWLPCLVLTCGGFFGYLAGEERRAPVALRRAGLEWAWRTAQDPRRLLPRYARGSLDTAAMATRILARAAARKLHRRGDDE